MGGCTARGITLPGLSRQEARSCKMPPAQMEANNLPRSSNLHAHVNQEKAKKMDLFTPFLHLAGTKNSVPEREKKQQNKKTNKVWHTHDAA